MKKIILIILSVFVCRVAAYSASDGILVEAESFADKGGWVTDQQFMDLMGSPYLLAHGMGRPVEDAETTVRIPVSGEWHVYVRTCNWTSPWILFDFRSPYRFHPTNQEDWNRKGLVSDQGYRKAAWYIMRDYYEEIKNTDK